MNDSNSNEREALDPVDEIAGLLADGEDETEDTSEVGPSSETSEEAEQEEQTVEQEDEEDGEEPSWASALGVADDKVVTDDAGNLVGLNVKVDGVVSTVGVKDLIAGYQTTQDYTRKTQALSNERKEFEAERTRVLQEYTTRLGDVERLTEMLYKQTVQPFERIDWNHLRNENPAEYAALIQDYHLKQGEFKQMMGAIQQDKNLALEASAAEQNQRKAAFVQKNADRLISMYPEWADKAVAGEAFSKMADFAESTYGFSKDEFAEIIDARAIGVLMDAMKFHQGKKIVDKAKLKTLPKFQSGKKAAVKRMTKLDQLTKRAQSARGAQKRVAQADAISELLLNG